MKLLPLATVVTFMTCRVLAQGTPAEHQQVQQTVISLFDALSARDARALRERCTTDAKFNEYGQAWSVDTLISLAITPDVAPDFKRINQLDFLSTTVKDDVAWTTYNLHSTITANGKTTEVYWMETVIAEKKKKQWKVRLLHSTRVSKT